MSDVKDILGIDRSTGGRTSPMFDATFVSSKKKKKPQGMSREVFALLGNNLDQLPSIVPTVAPTSMFRDRIKSQGAVKWSHTTFNTSARTDKLELKHWVKASTEYPDYPFAKFNLKIKVIKYSNEEYESVTGSDLAHSSHRWNRTQTDRLFQLINQYDMRWLIVADRYDALPFRAVEECKARYYDIASKVLQLRRQNKVSLSQDEITLAEYTYNLEYDERRKRQLDIQFLRSKDDEKNEKKLVQQLKKIDVSLKKLMRDSGSTASALAMSEKAKELPVGALDWRDGTSYSLTTTVTSHDNQTKQIITQVPGAYLRSQRLEHNTGQHEIPSQLMEKMEIMLVELHVPTRPLPTSNVCDAYDGLRQGIIKLLLLQSEIAKKVTNLGIKSNGLESTIDHLMNSNMQHHHHHHQGSIDSSNRKHIMNLAQANITKTGQNNNSSSSSSSHVGGMISTTATSGGGATVNSSDSNSNKRKASDINVDSTGAASKRPCSKRARRSTTVYNS